MYMYVCLFVHMCVFVCPPVLHVHVHVSVWTFGGDEVDLLATHMLSSNGVREDIPECSYEGHHSPLLGACKNPFSFGATWSLSFWWKETQRDEIGSLDQEKTAG